MPEVHEEIAAELATKQKALADLFESRKVSKDGKETYEFKSEELEKVRADRKELDDMGIRRELAEIQFKNALSIADLEKPRHPSAFGNNLPAVVRTKSLGEMMIDSPEYKSARGNGGKMFRPFLTEFADIDVKTVMMETGTGYAPANNRIATTIYSAQRQPMVTDLIPSGQTTSSAIKYLTESTFTNGAGMRAEGALIGEAGLGFTEVTSVVEWLPVILPVTEQQLDDVPQLMDLINNRLMLMLQLVEETQVLTGTGDTPQVEGFLDADRTGVQVQAKGLDDVPDAIFKAMTLVRYTGFAEPDGLVIHPTNWQAVQLQRTTDGVYIWGAPNATTSENRIWGVRTVVTPAITQGTALVGAFGRHSHLSYNRGVRFDVGTVDDDFARGKKSVRMYIRFSLEVYREAAFAKITGL